MNSKQNTLGQILAAKSVVIQTDFASIQRTKVSSTACLALFFGIWDKRSWMLNSRPCTALQHESAPKGLSNKWQGHIERCGPLLLGPLNVLLKERGCRIVGKSAPALIPDHHCYGLVPSHGHSV